MTMMVNPFRFGGGGGGGLPDDVIAYAASPTSNVFDFTGLSLSAYQRIVLYLDDVTVDTNNTHIILQFYISTSLITTGYAWSYSSDASANNPAAADSTSASNIRLTGAADTGTNATFGAEVHIMSPAAAVNKLTVGDAMLFQSTGEMVSQFGSGGLANTGTIDGLKISGSGGLITAGRAMILAMRTS